MSGPGAGPEPDLGKYRLLLDLAAGGMGSVHLARHHGAAGFERLVVIKRIHPHLAAIPEFVDMFLDEAHLASQIRHPNVVPVDDVIDAEGELFLAQPYVESVPLSALIEAAAAAGERLPKEVTARVLLDALAGLDGAHHAVDLRGERLEIVHRDVSPQNILVGVDGRSRLIDFGIARAARRLTITQTGAIKGKLRYLAPEQLRRQPVDARADVFSAGVVLYEALTGVAPFAGDDEGDTLLSILLGEPPPPSSRAPDVPPLVDEVVARALSTERDQRHSSAAAFHEALERALLPAPPREVALAVERLCGARVADLRERVRARLDAPPLPPLPPIAHAAVAPLGTPAVPRSRRGLAAALVVVAAIGLLGTALAASYALPREGLGAARTAPIVAPPTAPEPAPPAATATLIAAPPAPPPAAARRAITTAPTPARPPPSASDLHPNPYADPR